MTQDGEVLRFDAERGFGFIGTADGRRDIFFHVRDVRGGEAPNLGERVRFERIDVGGKGPRAMAVQRLGGGRAVPSAGATAPGVARAGSPGRGATQASSGAARSTAAASRTADRAPNRSTHPSASANADRPTGRPGDSVGRTAAPRRGDGGPRGLDGQPWLFTLAVLAWLVLLVLVLRQGALPVSAPALLGGLALLNVATFIAYASDKNAAQQGRWRTPENTLHALALAGGWPAAWLAQRALRHKSRKAEFLAVYVVTVLLNLGALAWLAWHGR